MNETVSRTSPLRNWWACLALVLLAAILAFRPGLTGPLLLDDFHNLAPLAGYDEGERSAANVIFGNTSGLLGRSVSMASFVANVALFGNDVYALKAGSLALHLLTGVLVTLLLRRLLARAWQPGASAASLPSKLGTTGKAVNGSVAPSLLGGFCNKPAEQARHYGWAAWGSLLLGAIWLLHPMQVSTVLYVVQRMALLAALFSFAALLVYVIGRERIERGQRGGGWLLFVAFPLLALLATFSKENGVLAPLLAAVIEWTLFRPGSAELARHFSQEHPPSKLGATTAAARRPLLVRIWLAVFVALPAVLAGLALMLKPRRFLNYGGRDFTLAERLMTEARIVWDYVGTWLAPFGPRMGLFHDNYPVSTSLLSPPATLLALLAWALVIVAAIALRKRLPLFTTGVGLFLGGHLMESTVLPLELYFEHRNYLPSIGLLLALAALAQATAARLREPTPGFRRLATALLFALPLAYGAATWARSTVWGSEPLLWAQQEAYNPDSARMRSNLVQRAIEAGDLPAALHHIDLLEPGTSPRDRIQPPMLRLLAYCAAGQAAHGPVYEQMQAAAHGPITLFGQLAWQELVTRIEAGDCPTADAARLIAIGQDWLAQAPGPTWREHWKARFYLGLLQASQGRYAESEAEIRRAWNDSGHDPHTGILLYQLNGTLGNTNAQQDILQELERQAGQGNHYVDRAVEQFRTTISTSP